MADAIFNDEVMLAGWRETHSGGATVTFWLPDSSTLDVFRGMTIRKNNTAGQRLAMCLVEIGDDEKPVEAPKATVGPLCMLALQWCRSPVFYAWIATVDPKWVMTQEHGMNEALSRRWLCDQLNIESRKELDTSHIAGEMFKSHIRAPFMSWMKDNGKSVE